MNSKFNDNSYIDLDFGVFNYNKYKLDLVQYKFTKICMTQIVNAEMMIANYGEEAFKLSCKEILAHVSTSLKLLRLDTSVLIYVNNYRTFIVASNETLSDKDFEQLMRSFYEQFERSQSVGTKLTGISRFVLIFGGYDMVDRAKSALYYNRNSSTNYIIASNEKELISEQTNKNVEIFTLINSAISNNRVVPFYQGIYDNKLGVINKYEALMRIYDSSGKIYPPGYFLEVAKKFKLYHILSKMIIDQALQDFENKKSELSINISFHDIENPEFNQWFFNRLKNYSNSANIIIEFVESENYIQGKKLFDFLNTARDLGCKIAVDDFGVGFSTYISIVALKPHIIKIDGEIIKNIVTHKDNEIILESICYMAKLIGAKTTAEFVENSEIQNLLEKKGVDFSQGYYFSKPLDITELSIE